VALVLGGLAGGLGLGELSLRLAFPSYLGRFRSYELMESERGRFCQYDSLLGWAGIPYAEGRFEWLDCRLQVRQNRFGWRGPAYDPSSPAAERIVVLGDSFTWGFGVEEEEIFTRILERISRIPVEVVNTGVSGYGTGQEYLLWRTRGHLWRPRRVILALTIHTDFYDNLFAERYGYPKPVFRMSPDGSLTLANVPVPRREGDWGSPGVKVRRSRRRSLASLAARSAVASLALDAASRKASLRGYLERHELIPRPAGGSDWEGKLYREPPDAETRAGWNVLFALIRELREDVESRDATLVVMLVPSVVQVYGELWNRFARRFRAAGMSLDPLAPNRLVAETLGREGLAVIDPLSELRRAGRTNPHLYFPQNRHWTADGHRLAAEVLGRELGLGDRP
jgi:hypothetical protein